MVYNLLHNRSTDPYKSNNFIFNPSKLKSMNVKLLLLIISIAAFSSCSTAYKTGQTPDDVYFSPTPLPNEEVKTERQEERTVYQDNSDDREIRSRIRNRRWRYEDEYAYNNYHPYHYNYYNPYYHPGYYIGPKTGSQVKYYTPRKINFGGYKSPGNNTSINLKTGLPQSGNAPVRTFKNNSSGSSVGNLIRKIAPAPKVITTRDNDNNNTTPVRTFEPKPSNNSTNSSSNSSSSSSSSSNSGSSSVPVRTFDK